MSAIPDKIARMVSARAGLGESAGSIAPAPCSNTSALVTKAAVDMTTRWPKACRCGETWSREHWGELTPVGRYMADEWIELRSCVCGKTLVVPTSELVERSDEASG